MNLTEAICFRPLGVCGGQSSAAAPDPTLQAALSVEPLRAKSLNISGHKKAWPPSQSQGLESGLGAWPGFYFSWVLFFLGGPEAELQGWGQAGGEGRQRLPRAIRKMQRWAAFQP